MKLLFLILFLVSSLLSREILRVATVPWQSEKELFQIYHPLLQLLEDKTGEKVDFILTKDYAELSNRILTKSVDIAIFGASSYVDAKYKNPKLIYLATSKQPTDHYNSIIITKKDSNIKSMSDLKNISFGFTDKGSTSGYLYPNLMLSKANINPKKDFKSITMLKKHYKIYGAVASGSIDAGGTTNTYYQEAVEKYGDIFRIIKKSKDIPQGPIIAAPHLSKTFIKKIKKILKEETKNNNYFTKKRPNILRGISIRSDSYYDSVREVKKFMPKGK
jgi:phosphonate transport system substrate-binding protein